MLSVASVYNAHSSMQIRDTRIFISSIIQKTDWLQEDEDVVMDIGCGPGKTTRNLLLPSFPRTKKVIAIDVLPEMIDFANKNYAHEKIEYHVADIEERNTMGKWSQKVSKVMSFFCLHWLRNQEDGFRNIYLTLKDGGEAALLFVLNSSLWHVYPDLIENPKWNEYFKNINLQIPDSCFKNYGTSYYRKLLESIGFDVIVCEVEDKTYAYQDDDYCKDAISSISPLTNHTPAEMKAEFKEDLFQGFLEHGSRNCDGRPMMYYTILKLLVQKPKA